MSRLTFALFCLLGLCQAINDLRPSYAIDANDHAVLYFNPRTLMGIQAFLNSPDVANSLCSSDPAAILMNNCSRFSELGRDGASAECRLEDNHPVQDGGLTGDEAEEYLDEEEYKLNYMYTAELPIPGQMQQAEKPSSSALWANVDYYEVAVRYIPDATGILQGQYEDKDGIMRDRTTPVFAYGENHSPISDFTVPSRTIYANVGRKVVVKWINDITTEVDDEKHFVPHMFPIDQTLHWADPECTHHEYSHEAYEGPVPMVVHFHGGHTNQMSDGYPDTWVLPEADNLPEYIRRVGPAWELFKKQSDYGAWWTKNSVVSDYLEERAAHLWYHDHAIGITRLNVQAGMVGNFFIVDPAFEGEDANVVPWGELEIPLTLFDRTFFNNGSMYYPKGAQPSRPKGDKHLPYMGEPTCNGYGPSDIPPIWRPGVLGGIHLVNGVAFPFKAVYPTCYRLRILQGSGAKTFNLKLRVWEADGVTPVTEEARQVKWHVIGADHGYLPEVTQPLEALFMMPAERIDVLVDFSALTNGETVEMWHDTDATCPDPTVDDCEQKQDCHERTTEQIMSFNVTLSFGNGEGQLPESRNRGCIDGVNPWFDVASSRTTPNPPEPGFLGITNVRTVWAQVFPSKSVIADPVYLPFIDEYCPTAAERAERTPVDIDFLTNSLDVIAPTEITLRDGTPLVRPKTASDPWLVSPKIATIFTMSSQPWKATPFSEPITDYPVKDQTEVWEIFNMSPFPHPIHIHEGRFEILGHTSIRRFNETLQNDADDQVKLQQWWRRPWEAGWKDVVVVPPYSLSRLAMRFTRTGLYVYHCHILTHEDRDMMRPMCITESTGVLNTACEMANKEWGDPCVEFHREKAHAGGGGGTDGKRTFEVHFNNNGACTDD